MANIIKILITSTVTPIKNAVKTIKFNGGIWNSLYTIYRTDCLKVGKLVGWDKYGNKYYENPKYFYLRDRWVVYADYHNLNYDASQVPPEWHGWLHHSTDELPSKKNITTYCYSLDHSENKSGTTEQYYPYSTVKPKILSWEPPDNESNSKCNEIKK